MDPSPERGVVRRAFVNREEGRLRAGWRLLVGIVVLIAASTVAYVALAVVAPAFPEQRIVAALLVAAAGVGIYAVQSGAVVALGWVVDRRTLADLGLGGDGWWRNLGFGLVLGLAMTTAVFLVLLALGLITVEGTLVTRPGLDIGTGVGMSAGVPVALALALTFLFFVGVGVFEELAIRGYLMTNVAEGVDGLGPVGPRGAIAVAAVATSALFGLLHLSNPNASPVSAFNIAVIGLYFAAAFVVTDDLGVPIGVHVTWNFSLSSVYGFPVSGLTTPATVLDVRQTGDPLVTGGAFGPEAGLVVYVALGVALVLTWWWVRRGDGAVRFREGVAVPDLRNAPSAGDAAAESPAPADHGAGKD